MTADMNILEATYFWEPNSISGALYHRVAT